MAFIGGTFFDPTLQQRLLLLRQSEMRFRWRHQHVRIVADDALPSLAVFHVARHNRLVTPEIRRRTFQSVEPQVSPASMFVWAMTMEAGFRKDRTNVTIELQLAIAGGVNLGN